MNVKISKENLSDFCTINIDKKCISLCLLQTWMCLEIIIVFVKPSYSITITLAQQDAQKSNTNTAKIGEKNIGALKMRNNIWCPLNLFFFNITIAIMNFFAFKLSECKSCSFKSL